MPQHDSSKDDSVRDGSSKETDCRAADDAARQRAAFTRTFAAMLAVIAASVYFALPNNVTTPSWAPTAKFYSSAFVPQGWAFFTKSPQSEQMGAYRPDGGEAPRNLSMTPQGRASNLFGLTRRQRAQGPEEALLNAQVRDWEPCQDANDACVREAAARPAQDVTNASPLPSLCGDVVMTNERPVPWAYRDLSPDTSHITRTVHLRITCHG
ncbi:SdpA family antimicrobial peptide system protein [Streptomyces sp. XH2]|uniref:SdpA family antimicrobial peptide system protein n=1 Tax=Streptomyces sp. XH2 TaxID=3412483 RepID=UPI003C7E6D43